MSTADDILFQDQLGCLKEECGLDGRWDGDYAYLITDTFYVDRKTLKIDYHIGSSTDGWDVDIKYFGY